MKNTSSSISIKRLTKLSKNGVSEFNTLLDEGMTWDVEQGNKFLANTDNALFVAYWNNTPVGFLTAHRLQRFDARKAEVLLYEIGVSEDHQRNGIGRSLVEALKSWARSVDADEIWVLTNKSNPAAMALYTATGAVTESSDEQMFVYKI